MAIEKERERTPPRIWATFELLLLADFLVVDEGKINLHKKKGKRLVAMVLTSFAFFC